MLQKHFFTFATTVAAVLRPRKGTSACACAPRVNTSPRWLTVARQCTAELRIQHLQYTVFPTRRQRLYLKPLLSTRRSFPFVVPYIL